MSTPRRLLFGKLNLTLFRAIESATTFCKLRGNPYVELAHWLHQLWQLPDADMQRVCRHYSLEINAIERDLLRSLDYLPAGASAISDFSHHIEAAIERAWVLASLNFGDTRIRGAWLLLALLETPDLRRVLVGISSEFASLPLTQLASELPAVIAGSPEDSEPAHDGSGLTQATPGTASDAIPEGGDGKSALTKYCTDLTALARNGGMDPVVGRDHEIRTMVDILLRRRQNNPLLTGEAGVGKTAVVEGLAQAIATQQVPPSLQNVRLLSLDVGALLAGASMRGEFESRLKALLEEASKSPQPVLLFVDEIHTLVGAGGQAGTGDAANLLKPALARGTLRTIGATTWSEYKRHIEKDPALTRRFQVLQVMEPQEANAIDMVRGLVPTFMQHHGVTVLDEAVRAAVQLSHRYIPARQLPDKAISLLDTACARVAMSLHAPPAQLEAAQRKVQALQAEKALLQREAQLGFPRDERLLVLAQSLSLAEAEQQRCQSDWQREQELVQQLMAQREGMVAASADAAPVDSGERRQKLQQLETQLQQLQGERPLVHAQVDETVVAAIVADWTGIPVGRMVQDDISAVLALQDRLGARVIGQDTALQVIAERIRTSRAGLNDPGKPVGIFMLVGPSGVGKTETALALADALYGGEHQLITINMSEYQEAHTVSSLKGSPPGYVGYGEGGVLTEAVRRKPYSVILLDEVEKAHPDVHEVFYQVFDKGWMEDGEGLQIDFRNTLILLTSNTGSDLLSQLCDDPALVPPAPQIIEALQPELRRVFPAAFLGRLAIVPYMPLPEQILQDIVRLQLGKVVRRLAEQHAIALHFTDAVVEHIVSQCGAHETGARRLSTFIEQHVLPPLADLWLQASQQHQSLSDIHIELCPAGQGSAQATLSFSTIPTTSSPVLATSGENLER